MQDLNHQSKNGGGEIHIVKTQLEALDVGIDGRFGNFSKNCLEMVNGMARKDGKALEIHDLFLLRVVVVVVVVGRTCFVRPSSLVW
jgi:hypothetical protein